MEASEAVIVDPKRKVSRLVKKKLQCEIQEEAQVIVHCSYTGDKEGSLIRIWKSTFLVPHESNKKSSLIHCDNISLYPSWTPVEPNNTLVFTLAFSTLPKSCKMFDLIESIPEPGGFEVKNIRRNKTDVYRVKI